MKNIVPYVICSFFLIIPFSNAMSLEKIYDYWVHGDIDCGDFLAGCDKNKLHIDCQAQLFFVLGYMSGYSEGKPMVYRKPKANSVKYALINYCRKYPLQSTYDAARSILFNKLSK